MRLKKSSEAKTEELKNWRKNRSL